METKFINCNGCRLAYFEQNEQAPYTIFFIHGNSVSKRCWRKQYESPLLSAFRMIAIDLPAHGESEAAEIENYTLPGLAKYMSAVVKALADHKPYLLAGISLSTNIITEMLNYDVRPKGLILAGPTFIGSDHTPDTFIKPGTQVGVVFTDDPSMENVALYGRQTSFSTDESDHALFINDFSAVRSPFRSALAQSIAGAEYSDEIALLQKENIPLLVVFGKSEAVVDPDYLDDVRLPLWRDRIFKIESASHLVNIDQPEEFNRLFATYAADIFR